MHKITRAFGVTRSFASLQVAADEAGLSASSLASTPSWTTKPGKRSAGR
jgi:hypothetical protein